MASGILGSSRRSQSNPSNEQTLSRIFSRERGCSAIYLTPGVMTQTDDEENNGDFGGDHDDDEL